MGFQNFGHFLLQGWWKLTICLCCDDLVTCSTLGFGIEVEQQYREDTEDRGQFVYRGSRMVLGSVQLVQAQINSCSALSRWADFPLGDFWALASSAARSRLRASSLSTIRSSVRSGSQP